MNETFWIIRYQDYYEDSYANLIDKVFLSECDAEQYLKEHNQYVYKTRPYSIDEVTLYKPEEKR